MERRQRNNGLTMTTFHSRQLGDARRTRKNENADTFNFASQIAPPICAVMHMEHDKSDAIIFKSLCKRKVVSKCFYTREALPLSFVRFLRLANGSSKNQRSPARRSRNGREATDKTSGEMSRVMSAQLPSNSLTMAVAIPLDDRRDDSQDNLRYTRLGCAMAVQETCETTRNLSTRRSRGSRAAVRATANATSCKLLPGISSSTFSHDTQKL
jgi:hypothetical protein